MDASASGFETAGVEGKPPVVLSIAGFDPSNGAGITADLQVFSRFRCFGTAAVTALTVQSTVGVARVEAVTPELLAETLRELCADLTPAGVKVGMLGSLGCVQVVAEFLSDLRLAADGTSDRPRVVLDPVLRSSSGAALLGADAVRALLEDLLPVVDFATPNWAELAVLSGMAVRDEATAWEAMEVVARRAGGGLGLVATGGENDVPTDLVLLADGERALLRGERVETTSTHGTGCAFSSALLCGLVLGRGPLQAAEGAKRFVADALRNAPGLGRGRGPMGLAAWAAELPERRRRVLG